MEDQLDYRQALTKAMEWCGKSERCSYEVRLKLKSFGISDDQCDMAIDYMTGQKFLDDKRYARFFINDKLKFNKWGKVKLNFMLGQKQICDVIINEALNEIDHDFYIKTLRDLLVSKVKSVRGTSVFERKGKLANFAQSHGFESELAYRIADELIKAI